MKYFLTFLTLFITFHSFAQAKETLFGSLLCKASHFTCYEVLKGDSWESLWPDEFQRDIIKRANRMNVRLKAGMILAIPSSDKFPTVFSLSPLPQVIETGSQKLILVDLSQLAWGAYDDQGKLIQWGPASGGKKWCSDVRRACQTPSGDFSILRKGTASCRSHIFPIPKGGAPMPYCLFFKGGYALHGSYEVPGYNASHGCVRLFSEDARWLNENFVELPHKENSYQGTKVKILSLNK